MNAGRSLRPRKRPPASQQVGVPAERPPDARCVARRPSPSASPGRLTVDVHQDPQEVGENRMRDRSLADRVPLGAGPQVARDRGPAPPCLQRG